MKRTIAALLATCAIAQVLAAPDLPLPLDSENFRHIGSFVVRSRLKITGDHVTQVEIKPVTIDAFTNGIELRLIAAGSEDASSSFELYRTDGVGRVNEHTGVLEVVPGLQGSSCRDGVLRHVRVTRDCLTLTQFAGVSNQTTITHAVARQDPPTPPDPPPASARLR